MTAFNHSLGSCSLPERPYMYYSFALILLVHGALAARCPADWISPPDETSCYLLQNEFHTWQDSRDLCQEKGGDLLVVNSDKEWDWIASKLYPSYYRRQVAWFIGLRAVYEETSPGVGGFTWKWIDGREFQSSPSLKWANGEPSDEIYSPSNDDCGLAINSGNLTWAFNFDGILTWVSACEKEKEGGHDVCPEYWLDREGFTSCYYINTLKTTWFEARDECKASGGDLVSVNSQEEKEWLREAMEYYRIFIYWVGLSKNNLTKEWEWTDGTSHDPRIFEWYEGYPKVREEAPLHFALYASQFSGLITFPHSAGQYSVCEITGVPYRIACEAPPPPMEEMEMSCHAPSGREVQCHDVRHSEGTMAVYRCREPFQSTTGLPMAYSVCDQDQNWPPLPAFQCVLHIE